jgi:pimeloyl-ACP methyl ester carboxylesterase
MAPLADEVLRLSDGRMLAWTEWGDPRGRPVVFLHPCPGSRMFCPDEQVTAGQGVRLITIDRPGYGGSDPVTDPTLTGFALDLVRLVDHLWLGQFAVVGWSGGGPYAAACAALLGERVSALGLVAAPASHDRVPSWCAPLADLRRLVEEDVPQALTTVAASTAGLAADPDRVGEQWSNPSNPASPASPADANVNAHAHAAGRPPGADQALRIMWREGLRPGVEGVAADVVASLRPWDFAPSEVLTPASLFYGDDDPVVSLADGRWWEEALPTAHLRVMRGGHLLPLLVWPEILRAVQA